MCVQESVRRGTHVRAIAWVCARPLLAGHHRLPLRPSGRVQRRVCPECGHPPLMGRRTACAGRAGWPTASGAWGLWLSVPSPALPAGIFCFPEPPAPPPRSALGQGPRAVPPGRLVRGGRAAGRPPPLPCRPRPGALMGFSMTASGRGPPLFPWSPAAARLPRRAPGFFQGSTGAWRCRLLHFPTQTPASCARARAATPARPRDHLRGAVPSPDARLAPSLRALSPTCARKVDRLRARTPPRLAPRAPPGLQVGGRGSGGCGAGPPMPPGCGRASRFPQGVGVQSGR